MGMISCKECKQQISSKAKACPHCGVKLAHTSMLSLGCGIMLIGFLLFCLFTYFVTRNGTPSQNASPKQTASKVAEQKRLATLTPEQRVEEEKNRVKKEALRKEAELRTLGLKWNYDESADEMGRGEIKTAMVRSLNEVTFDFPYAGAQRGTLRLRLHPKFGKDVILTIERGQFLCDIDGCSVTVRFGNGNPQTFSVSEPADRSTTMLFLNNYDRFVANTKKVEKVFIETQFYQEGNRVFEFDVSGLDWPRVK